MKDEKVLGGYENGGERPKPASILRAPGYPLQTRASVSGWEKGNIDLFTFNNFFIL
jgi:hypothetical protein